jgi:hypothetical protein
LRDENGIERILVDFRGAGKLDYIGCPNREREHSFVGYVLATKGVGKLCW